MRKTTNRLRRLRVETLEPRQMLAAQLSPVDWMGPVMVSPYASQPHRATEGLQELVTHTVNKDAESEQPVTQAPELLQVRSSSCNTRHVYVLVVHGLQLKQGEPAWAKRIRNEAYNFLKSAPEQYFAGVGAGSFLWDSGFNSVAARSHGTRGASTSQYADDAYEFLKKNALERLPAGHKIDILMIGHSRGGVLVNQVGAYIEKDPRVDYVQSIMLDPTASTHAHGDRYPEYLYRGIDYNILYHDDFSLNKQGGGLGALLSNIVSDQKAIQSGGGNTSISYSLGQPIYNAIKNSSDSKWKNGKPKYGTHSYSITSHVLIQDAWRTKRLKQDLQSFLQRKDRDSSCASTTSGNPTGGTLFFDDDAPRKRGRHFYSAGESFTPRVQVVNANANPTGELRVAYYLSSDSTVTTADTLLSSGARPGAASNRSLDWRETLPLPASLAAGTYYAAALAQSSRGWSLASEPIAIEIAQPPEYDLAVQQVSILGADLTVPGQAFGVEVSASIESGSSLEGYSVEYLLAPTPESGSEPLLLNRSTRGPISGGGQRIWQQELEIPVGVSLDNFLGLTVTVTAESEDMDMTNNSWTVPLRGASPFDISTRIISAPGSASPGDVVSFAIEFSNLGSETSVAFNASISLLREDGSDVIVEEVFSVPSIANGNSLEVVREIVIPADAEGPHTITAYANLLLPDSDSDNDSFVADESLLLPRRYNLSLDSLRTAAPSSDFFGAGDSFELDYSVQNTGTAPSETSSIGLYLRSDAERETGTGVLIASVDLPEIAGGEVQNGTIAVEVPEDTLPGGYHLYAVVDREGLLNEVTATDNAAALDQSIRVNGPADLVVDSISTPRASELLRIQPGYRFPVTAEIRNSGDLTAAESDFAFFLIPANENAISQDAVLLRQVRRGELAAGSTDKWTQTLEVPTDMYPRSCQSAGTDHPCVASYKVVGVADAADELKEAVEENNVIFSDAFEISFFAQEGGQFAVYDFGPEDSVVAEGTFSVEPSTTFTESRGYGWTSGTVGGYDWQVNSPLFGDLNFTSDATFRVDVPNGLYSVSVALGDAAGFTSHDFMQVVINGHSQPYVDTYPGQVASRTYYVEVREGALNVQFRDAGGFDPFVPITALSIYKGRLFNFDFNAPFSPTSDGAFPVTEFLHFDDGYGYGWSQGWIQSIDAGFGEFYSRDANITQDGVFSVSVPNGQYSIRARLGSLAPYAFPNMEVFLNDSEPTQLSASYGEVVPFSDNVYVDSGRLDFRIAADADHGAYAGISSLGILEVPIGASPRVTGLDAISFDTSNNGAASFEGETDTLLISFRNAMDASSLNNETVRLISPEEEAIPIELEVMSPVVLKVTFEELRDEGTYHLSVDASVMDIYGRMLDQDEDTVLGEGEDQFNAQLVVEKRPEIKRLSISEVVPSSQALKSNETTGPVNTLRITFDAEVDEGSFDIFDVLQISGPEGLVAPRRVEQLEPKVFLLEVDPVSTPGTYTVVIGNDIRGANGAILGDSSSIGANGWSVRSFEVVQPWTNPDERLDVDGDGRVLPIDALIGINYLNRFGNEGTLPEVREGHPFYDVNGDGKVSPIDSLKVINYLNRRTLGEGEPTSIITDSRMPKGISAKPEVCSPLDADAVEILMQEVIGVLPKKSNGAF